MSSARPTAPGTTRRCPHCRATILESASVCPQCRHHLRFDPGAKERAESVATPFKVEGTIRQPATGKAAEYAVVVAIRNEAGEEIGRHVVGVGAIQPSEARSFILTVEMQKPG